MSKNDQDAPAFEDDTDLLISQLKSEIKSLQSQNSSSQDKIAEGISKVEEQLNIQSPENSNIYNLDLMDRILRVGSNVKSLHSQISNQIFDIFSRGLYDTDFLKDTLTTIQSELEGSAMLPLDDFEAQETLQNLRKIALEETSEIEILRKALKDSLMIHQDSESKIKSLRARIFNLEHQITFYIESNKNPGTNPENLEICSDDENSSELSPFALDIHANSLQIDPGPRTISRNKIRSASVRSRKFHKPHNSINPTTFEGVDHFSLSKVQQQEIESNFKDQIFQLNTSLSQCKTQIELDKQNEAKLKAKYDKLVQNYKILSKKFTKLTELNKQYKAKIKGLEDQLQHSKETIEKLQEPSQELVEKTEMIEKLKKELENTQVQIMNYDANLNKHKSGLSILKKKYEQTKQKSDSFMDQLSIIERYVFLNDTDQTPQIEGQNQSDRIIDRFGQLKSSLRKSTNQVEQYITFFLNIRQTVGLSNENLSNFDNSVKSETLFNKEINEQIRAIYKENEDYKALLEQIKATLGMTENKDCLIVKKIMNYLNENERVKSQLRNLLKSLGLSEINPESEEEVNSAIKQAEIIANENKRLKEQMNEVNQAVGVKSSTKIVEQINKINKESRQMKDALKAISKSLNINSDSLDNESDPSSTEKICSEIISAVQKQTQQHDEVRKTLGNDSSDFNELMKNLKTQLNENEILKSHLNSLRSTLGLSEFNITGSKTVEEQCAAIQAEVKQLKEVKEKLQNEMSSVKKSLGIKGQLESKEGGVTSRINSLNTENDRLKKQVQEMCDMLGIPNVTERSIGNEDKGNNIKDKISKLQRENEGMKEEIIKIAESIGIDTSKLKTATNIETLLKEAAHIQELIIKLRSDNNKLRNQNDIIRETLGLGRITEEELNSEKISEMNDKIKERTKTLQTQNNNLKEQNNKLTASNNKLRNQNDIIRETLGLGRITEEELNSDNISEMNEIIKKQAKTLQTQNDNLKEQNNKLREALGLPPIDYSKESSAASNSADKTESESSKEMISMIEKEREENSILKKELDNLYSALGINDKDIPANMTIEERCKLINNRLREVQEDKEELDTEMRALKKSLGIEDEENDETNKTDRINKSRSSAMIDQIQLMNKENSELKAELKKIRENLGLSTSEGEMKESASIFNKIDEVKNENQTLKEKVQEMCRLLGIPDFSEGHGEENEGANSINQIEKATNEIKKQLNDLQTRNNKLSSDNNKLRNQNDIIREALGLGRITEEELNSEKISEMNEIIKKQAITLQTQNDNLKEQNNKLREALGLPPIDYSKESSAASNSTEKSESDLASQNGINEMLKLVQNDKEENSLLKKQFDNLFNTLGISLPSENGETSLEDRCNKVNDEVKLLKENKEKLEAEMRALKQSLGIEDDKETKNSEEQKNKPSILDVVQNTTKENNEMKEQINIISSENDRLKKQVQEMCDMLGIPNVTERSIGNEDKGNNIKDKISKLQRENEGMKEEIIKIAESIGIDTSKLKTTTNIETLLKEATHIQELIIKLRSDNNKLRNQNDIIRETLGLGRITEEELNSEKISEMNDKIKERTKTLQTQNNNLKEQNNKLREALGLPPIDYSKTDITDKTHPEETKEKGIQEMISMIEKEREENSILKKELDNLYSALGINDKDIPANMTIEERCKLINNRLREVQEDKEELDTEMRALKKSLGIEDEENDETNKTDRINKSRSSAMIDQIQLMNKENSELKAELKKIRENLGLSTSEGEMKESASIFNKIDEVKNENQTLKEKVQEMCRLLGIPDFTEGHGEENEGPNNINQIEKATNEIKKQLNDLQTRNNKLSSDNNKLRNQNDIIREALGLGRITEEELNSEKISEMNEIIKKQVSTLQTQNDNLKEQNNKLTASNNKLRNQNDIIRETLGLGRITEEELNSDNISEMNEIIKKQAKTLQTQNDNLKEQNNKLREALGLPPIDYSKTDITDKTHPEETKEKGIQEMISMIEKEREENSILKKELDNLYSALGINDKDIPANMTIEERCKLINNRLREVQEDKEELDTEMRALKKSLGIEDESKNPSEQQQQGKKPSIIEVVETATKENDEMKDQLNKICEILGLSNKSKAGEILQSVQNQTDLFKSIQSVIKEGQKKGNLSNEEMLQAIVNMKKSVEEQTSMNQQKEKEINEIESLLQEEIESAGSQDSPRSSKSKIVRAIKRLKKNSQQLKKQLEASSHQHEQDKEELTLKLNEKQNELDDLKQKNIELQSKASGIMEERSSVINSIQSLISSPDSPKSPVYQKLNGISQEISNQQNVLGELIVDKEKWNKLEKFEEERTQIIDDLISEGLLQVQSRKDVNLPLLIQDILHERKEIQKQNEAAIQERSAVLGILDDGNENSNGIVNAFKKLQTQVSSDKERLDQLKKLLGIQGDDESDSFNEIVAAIKGLQKQLSSIRESLGLPPLREGVSGEKEGEIQVVSNLRKQMKEMQAKLEQSKKERDTILSSLGISASNYNASSDNLIDEIQHIKNEIDALRKERNEIQQSLVLFGDNQDHKNIVDSLKKFAQERQSVIKIIFDQEDSNESKRRKSPKSQTIVKSSPEVIDALEIIINNQTQVSKISLDNETQMKNIEKELNLLAKEFGIEFKQTKSLNSLDEKMRVIHGALKGRFDNLNEEAKSYKKHLQDYQDSIARVQKLLGIKENKNKGKFVNTAADLEAQIINFLKKTEEEQQNRSIGLEKKIAELEKKIDELMKELKALKSERRAALSILQIKDETDEELENVDDFILQLKSPLIAGLQKVTQDNQEQLSLIDKLKEHLTNAAKSLQSLSGERDSIMNALMPGGFSDSQTDHSINVLFKNLESLGIQISRQNDSMISVISEDSRIRLSESDSNPSLPRLRKRERPQRPQSHIVAALNTIRNQLENAQQELADKEIRIAELEDENEKLKIDK